MHACGNIRALDNDTINFAAIIVKTKQTHYEMLVI